MLLSLLAKEITQGLETLLEQALKHLLRSFRVCLPVL